jgi:uncharacterized Zn ribbon protein
MNDDTNLNNPLDMGHSEIRDSCEKIAKKFLPHVENALEVLMELDPYKGILAWERVAEFAVAKKSKENLLPQGTNIVINLVPVERSSNIIDITPEVKKIELSNENLSEESWDD